MDKTIIFDNDGTLYKVPTLFQKAIIKKMHLYLSRKLGLSEDELIDLRVKLLKKYKTESTFKAFNLEYGLEYESFVANTFLSVDPRDFISPDRKLLKILKEISGNKVILTNNPRRFAEAVLEAVGIKDIFIATYGEKEIDFKHKPNLYPFKIITKMYPGERVIVDDNIDNLIVANRLGFKCIHIGKSKKIRGISSVNSIYNIKRALK